MNTPLLLPFIGLVMVTLIGVVILLYHKKTSGKALQKLKDIQQTLEEERQRSEELLLNMLPAAATEELKAYGKVKPVKLHQASILFTDFAGFTKIAANMEASELVDTLNYYIKGFDFIISQYPDIEKIKTSGDSYMAASGLSFNHSRNNQSVINIIKAALEMQQFIEEVKLEKERLQKQYFEMRIGINTGSVIAGVIGVSKFQYDIWGDAVNLASRMESEGAVGQVNISQSTFELVKNQPSLIFTPRGKINAKGKGMVDMYFVKSKYI